MLVIKSVVVLGLAAPVIQMAAPSASGPVHPARTAPARSAQASSEDSRYCAAENWSEDQWVPPLSHSVTFYAYVSRANRYVGSTFYAVYSWRARQYIDGEFVNESTRTHNCPPY